MRITSWTRLLRELLRPARAQQRAPSPADSAHAPVRRRDSVDFDGGLFVVRMEERRVLNAAPAVTGSEPVAAPIEVPAPSPQSGDADAPQAEPSHQDIRDLAPVHADSLGSTPQDIADKHLTREPANAAAAAGPSAATSQSSSALVFHADPTAAGYSAAYTLLVSGNEYQIVNPQSGQVYARQDVATTSEIYISGALTEANTLTLDASVLEQPAHVHFDGHLLPQATLVVSATSSTHTVYTPDATVYGSGHISAGLTQVDFVGLTPINVNGGSFTLSLPGQDDIVTLQNRQIVVGLSTVNVVQITGTTGGVAFELANVWNAANVTIDTTEVDGNDQVTINSADAENSGTRAVNNLTINTGSGSDTFNVNGPITLAGSLTVTTPNMTFGGGALVQTGGSVDLNARVTFGGDATFYTEGTASVGGNIRFRDTVNAQTAGVGILTLDANHVASNAAGTIEFDQRVGGTTRLSQVQVVNTFGNVLFQGASSGVTTNDGQSYAAPVTLGAASSFTSTSGQLLDFQNTINGAFGLTANSTGGTQFSGVIGGTTALASLTTNGAGGTTWINTNAVTTTGAQSYNQNVQLTGLGTTTFTANSTPSASGGTAELVKFGGTLTGNAADLVFGNVSGPNVSTNAEFDGAVTVVDDLVVTGTTRLAATTATTVSTSGTQTYTGAVTLGAATSLASSGAGAASDITFSGTVNGAFSLAVSNEGVTTFGGNVGNTTSLTSFTSSSLGSTAINGGLLRTTGAQTYNNPVTIGIQNAALTSTAGGDIIFLGTVNGPLGLTVNTSGATIFASTVGDSSLASLTTDAGGSAQINGGLVQTSGAQSFGDAVTLGTQDATFTSTAGSITFAGTLDGPYNLAVNVSAGNTATFGGAVGSSVELVSLVTGAGGTTAINGGLITVTDGQTYNNNVTIGGAADAVLTSTAGLDVLFAGTVNGPRGLTVNTDASAIFNGAVGTLSSLDSLTSNAVVGTSISGGAVSTANNQTYNNDVTLGAALDTVFTGGAAALIRFTGLLTGNANDLSFVAATAEFDGMVTSVGNFSSGGKTVIAVATGVAVSTTGTQTYAGAVTLDASTTLLSNSSTATGDITFGGTVDSGVTAYDLTVNTDGTTTFNGNVGSASALLSLTTDTPGTTALNAAIVRTQNAQLYNDSVTVGGAAVSVLSSTASQDITFRGTVNGPQGLTVNTAGQTIFENAVGTASALVSLTTNSGGVTHIKGGAVSTTGGQTYGDSVTLDGFVATVFTATTGTPTIRFANLLTGNTLDLTFSGSNIVRFEGAVTNAADLSVAGSTTFAVTSGMAVSTSGTQTYFGAVTLAAHTTLNAPSGQLIRFGSTVGGAFALTIGDTDASDAEFDGDVGSAGTPLTALSVQGTTRFISGAALSVTTSGAQSYAGAATIGANTTLASTSAGNIAFGSSVNDSAAGGHSLTVNTSGVTTFDDVVGSTALASLATDAGGTTQINGGTVTTTGGQTYLDNVTLGASATTAFQATTAAALIRFGGTLTGNAFDVDFPGSTAGVEFDGAVSNIANLSVAGTSTFAVPAGTTVITLGTQTYTGAVTLRANTTLTSLGGSSAGDITFSSTVNSGSGGPYSLTVNTEGTTLFNAAVGATGASGVLASLTTDTVGVTAINGGAIITSGTQTYNDAVTLGTQAAVLTSMLNQNITFNGTLDGPQALTVTTGGLTTFAQAVGTSIAALASLTTNGGGTTAINGGAVLTTAAQTYTDAVTLGADAELTGTNITFSGTLDDDGVPATSSNLTVNASGITLFNAAVGAVAALTRLTTDGFGTTQINGGAVQTTAAQTYNDNVTLSVDTVLTGADITFAGTLQDNGGGATTNLTLNTSGVTTFGDAVGGASPTTALTSITTNAGGSTAINGGAVRTTGTQIYNDAVVLGADTTLNATQVRFGATLSGTGVSLLAAASTNVEFDANVGSVGGELNAVTINGTTTFGATAGTSVTMFTSGLQDFKGPVLLNQNTTLDTSAGSADVLFESTVDSATGTNRNLTVSVGGGNLTFDAAVGTTRALGQLTVLGTGVTSVNGGAVTTTGTQSFGEDVTLGFAGATVFIANTDPVAGGTAGPVTFGGTLTGNGNDVAFGQASGPSIPTSVVFNGAVNNVANLLVTGTTRYNVGTGTAVTTSGTQTYTGDVVVSVDTTLVSTGTGAAGNITFGARVNDAVAGTHTLTVNTAGTTAFNGAVGGTAALASLATDIPGTTQISGGAVTTTGAQAYGDNVVLSGALATVFTANLTPSTAGGAASLVSFGGTLAGNGKNVTFGKTTPSVPTDVQFGGSVSNVATLTVTGVTELAVTAATSIASTGKQTYVGAVTLAPNVTITFSNTGATGVEFGSTVDGEADLIVDTPGSTVFTGAVGSTVALNSLAVQTGGTVLNATGNSTTPTVTTIADQRYNGPVTFGAATSTYVQSGTGNIEFASTITGPAVPLTVDAAGLSTFLGNVTVAQLTVPGTSQISADVSTSAGQLYGGNVTLGTGTTQLFSDTGAASTIEFDGTISGAAALTVTTSATQIAVFKGTIGATPLTSFTVTNASLFDGTDAITTTGAQTYGGGVTLLTDVVATSTGGALIDFQNTVNGPAALVVTTTGNIRFSGVVGGVTPLATLTTNGPGGVTQINTLAVSTFGDQTYNKDVVLVTASGTTTFKANSTPTVAGGVAALIRFSNTLTGNGDVLNFGSGTVPTDVEFNGLVGNISNLLVSGRARVNTTAVTATGNQTYLEAVTLATSTTFTGVNMTFASTIDDDGSAATTSNLTVNGSGTTTFGGALGNGAVLTSVTTDAAGMTRINGGIVHTTAAQAFNDAVTLGADTTLTGTDVTFGKSLQDDGSAATDSNLVVNSSGITRFGGAVGGATNATALTSVTTDASGSTEINGSGVRTKEAQLYIDTVTLGASVTITGTDVTFIKTLQDDGSAATASNLVVNASGTTRFQSAVGGTTAVTALTSVTTNAAGDTVINGGSVLTTAAQRYNDAVTLGANTTFTGANITFASTLDDDNNTATASNVIVNGSGVTTFGGAVGDATGNSALTSLTTDAAGSTRINGGAVRTVAAQTYNDAVSIGADATLTGTNVTFAATLNDDGVSGTTSNLTIEASGTTTFRGLVGGATAATALTSLTTSAAGSTLINGGGVRTTADQTYGDPVTLGANTLLSGVNITFAQTLRDDGVASTPSNLTVNGSGVTIFGGVVGGSTASTALGSVTTDAAGSTQLNGNVLTTGVQNYLDPAALADGVPITLRNLTTPAGTTGVAFGSTLDGDSALIVDTAGTTLFNGLVGSATPLASVWVKTGAATLNAAGTTAIPTITTTAGQKYNGSVLLGAATNYLRDTSANIEFDSTLTGQAITVDAIGMTLFLGNVASTSLTVTGASRLGTDASGPFSVISSAGQTYGGAVTLGTGKVVSITDSGSGNVTFQSTIDGAAALTISTAGTTFFQGNIGGTPLNSLTVTGASAFQGAGSVQTTGAQVYGGTVSLDNDLTVTASSSTTGDITFAAIRAPGVGGLTVNAGRAATFNGAIGSPSLAFLDVTAPGGITLAGGAISTVFDQIYRNAVVLRTADAVLTSGSNVTFASTIDSTAVGPVGLTITAPGTTTLTGAIGNSTTAGLGQLAFVRIDPTFANTNTLALTRFNGGTLKAAGEILFGDTLSLGANTAISAGGNLRFHATVDATSTAFGLNVAAANTRFDADVGSTPPASLARLVVQGPAVLGSGLTGATIAVSTRGAQTYSGNVQIAADATLTSLGSGSAGNITFSGTLDDAGTAGTHNLTVNTAGITNFTGRIGGAAGAAALQSIATDGPGQVLIQGDVWTTGSQTFGDRATVGSSALTSIQLRSLSGGAIEFSQKVDDTAVGKTDLVLVTTGQAIFKGEVGATRKFHSISTAGAGSTAFITDLVLTTGNQTFGPNVTVDDSTTGIQFGAGTPTVRGTVTFNGSLTESAGGVTIGFFPSSGAPIISNAVFHGPVSVTALRVTGTANIDTTQITTTTGQEYFDAVTVSQSLVLTDSSGIVFHKTVDAATVGGQSLRVEGAATFLSDVGKLRALASLDIAGVAVLGDASAANVPISVVTIGTQTYENSTALASDVTMLAGNPIGPVPSSVLFQGVVTNGALAPKNLTIGSSTVATDVEFDHDVGAAGAELQALTIFGNTTFGAIGGTGATSLTVRTVSPQTYRGTTTLNQTTTLNTAAGNADIQLDSAINGNAASSTPNAGLHLVVGTANVTLNGAIGTTRALNQFTIDGTTGVTRINGGAITTLGLQSIGNAVRLGTNTTITTGSFINFAQTVDATGSDGAQSLAVAGSVQFGGVVGGQLRLASLSVTRSTAILSSDIKTTDFQTYGGQVTLQHSTTLSTTATSGSGAMTFNNRIDSGVDTSSNPFALTIITSGLTTLNGSVGAGLGGELASLLKTGGGQVNINGGSVVTRGTQKYDDRVLLGAHTTVKVSTATFLQTVDGGAVNHDMTVKGNVVFGDADADTVTNLRDLLVTGTSAIHTTIVTSSSSQKYTGFVDTFGTTLNMTTFHLTFLNGVDTHNHSAVLTSDTMSFASATNTFNTLGAVATDVIVRPRSADTLIQLADTTQPLELTLSDRDLDSIRVTNLKIGDAANTGGITMATSTSVSQDKNLWFITSGTVRVNGAVSTSNGGTVELTNGQTLTIAAAGDMTVDGNFVQDGPGAVVTAGDISTTHDEIRFYSPITLTGAVAFATTLSGSGAGDIVFSSSTTINSDSASSARNLTLAAGTGRVLVNANLGAEQALGKVTITSAAGVTFGTSDTRTSNVTFGTNDIFAKTIFGQTSLPGNLGLGPVSVVHALRGVDIGTGSNVIGGSGIIFNAGPSASSLLTMTTANANVRLNGAVTMQSDLKIDTGTGAGDITFTQSTTVNSQTGEHNDLTLTSGTGDILLRGSMGVAGGGDHRLGNVSARALTGQVGGAITMANGVVIDASSGTIEMVANGNVTVGRLVTTNASSSPVRLTSNSAGVVNAGNAAGRNISAPAAAIRAVTGIGSDSTLLTAVTTLSAVNSNTGNLLISNDVGGTGLLVIGTVDGLVGLNNAGIGTGHIQVTNAGALDNLDPIGGGTGDVGLTARDNITLRQVTTTTTTIVQSTAGGIVNARTTDGNVIVSANLSLQAMKGIGSDLSLQTAVGLLSASNASSGSIVVNNTTGTLLTVGTVGGVAGIMNTDPAFGQGNVVLTNNAGFNIVNDVQNLAGGNIVITNQPNASGTPSAEDLNQKLEELRQTFGNSNRPQVSDLQLLVAANSFLQDVNKTLQELSSSRLVLGASNGGDLTTTARLMASGGNGTINVTVRGAIHVDDTGSSVDMAVVGAGKITLTGSNGVDFAPNVILQSATGTIPTVTPDIFNVAAPRIKSDGVATVSGFYGNAGGTNYTIVIDWADGTVETYDRSGLVSVNSVLPPIEPPPGHMEYGNLNTPGQFTFTHFYRANPNEKDEAAPIPIKIQLHQDYNLVIVGNPPRSQIVNGNTTILADNLQIVLTIAENSGIGGHEKRIDLTPDVPSLVVPEPPNLGGTTTVTSSRVFDVGSQLESVVAVDRTATDQRAVILQVVDENGERIEEILLAEDVLNDLPGLFKKLPDGRYRIYLREAGERRMRLLIDVNVRQGKASDNTEGGQDKPPTTNIQRKSEIQWAETETGFDRSVTVAEPPAPEPDVPSVWTTAAESTFSTGDTADAVQFAVPTERFLEPSTGRVENDDDPLRTRRFAHPAVATALAAAAVMAVQETEPWEQRIGQALESPARKSLSKAARIVRKLRGG